MKVIKLSSGLGNQLFMFAFFLYTKSKYPDEDIFFDDKYFKKDPSGRISEIDVLLPNYPTIHFKFNPAGEKGIRRHLFTLLQKWFGKFSIVNESDFNPLLTYTKDCYFSGYWQTDFFVKEISPLSFSPVKKIPEILKQYETLILQTPNSVSIHFRRTDYFSALYIDRFGVCTETYYLDAMEWLEKNVKIDIYFVFSDDLEWVRKNINFNKNVIYIPNKNVNSYWYIYLMSLCHHNIIANSTFSWWGAYLNSHNDKIVVGPDKWTFDNDETIMCKEWKKIKV